MADALQPLYPWMHLLGRIAFSAIFIASGLNHLFKLERVAGYAAANGVPAPKVATVVTGIMILVGGVMVLLGWRRFIGAGLLAIFLPIVAVMMHAFWRRDDPMARANDQAHFMKNMALAGAALLVAFWAGDSWPMSLSG